MIYKIAIMLLLNGVLYAQYEEPFIYTDEQNGVRRAWSEDNETYAIYTNIDKTTAQLALRDYQGNYTGVITERIMNGELRHEELPDAEKLFMELREKFGEKDDLPPFLTARNTIARTISPKILMYSAPTLDRSLPEVEVDAIYALNAVYDKDKKSYYGKRATKTDNDNGFKVEDFDADKAQTVFKELEQYFNGEKK